MLKTLVSDTKIPCIPPLIVNDTFVTDFHEKAHLFNDFFAKQCSIIINNSSIPNSDLSFTNEHLSEFKFSKQDIYEIIDKLDPNKAHGHDMISVRMLKICGLSVCKPLKMIFKNCLNEGYFPNEWKRANVVPIHEKNDK